jgi:hypothetical protein
MIETMGPDSTPSVRTPSASSRAPAALRGRALARALREHAPEQTPWSEREAEAWERRTRAERELAQQAPFDVRLVVAKSDPPSTDAPVSMRGEALAAALEAARDLAEREAPTSEPPTESHRPSSP